MVKTMIHRAIQSFCYAIAITTIYYFAFIKIVGVAPLLPEYASRFDTAVEALIVQLLLVGIMSASLAGGTIIMEIEKLGLILQSLIYFVVSCAVWISVAAYCWGLGKYRLTAISLTLSYMISYSICWIIQYRTCKKNIDDINLELQKLGQND